MSSEETSRLIGCVEDFLASDLAFKKGVVEYIQSSNKELGKLVKQSEGYIRVKKEALETLLEDHEKASKAFIDGIISNLH